jgi:hypothetical protein
MTKISYAIPVCNEFIEIQRLINFLLENKRQEDEIVVLFDSNNGTNEVRNYLKNTPISFNENPFNGNFAEMKNHLTSLCKGDYIFQVDADEMLSLEGLTLIPQIIEDNPGVEVFLVPRINTIVNLTLEESQKFKWNVNEKGWINFPDFQWRIYKNLPQIIWKNLYKKTHERLQGHKEFAILPEQPEFCLSHPKTIERQIKQNEYYQKLES